MTPSAVDISVISTFAELSPEVIVVESPDLVITTVPPPSVTTLNDPEEKSLRYFSFIKFQMLTYLLKSQPSGS